MSKLKVLTLVLFSTLVLVLSGCGEKVTVPPAHKGIILHTSGYEGDFLAPSRFRLPVCWLWQQCPKLILISTQDQAKTEEMDVFLTESSIQIEDVEVNLVLGVNHDDKTLKTVLNKVLPVNEGGYYGINLDEIYRIYARETIREAVRQAVTEKSLEFLLANRQTYANEIHRRVSQELESFNSPIIVKRLSFAKLSPPESMRLAFENAKGREIALSQAEADKKVAIKKAEAELEVAEKQAAVRLLRARAFADEAKLMAAAITPRWLQMRQLEVQEAMASNGAAVFMPIDMSGDTAIALEQLKKLQQLTKQ